MEKRNNNPCQKNKAIVQHLYPVPAHDIRKKNQ